MPVVKGLLAEVWRVGKREGCGQAEVAVSILCGLFVISRLYRVHYSLALVCPGFKVLNGSSCFTLGAQIWGYPSTLKPTRLLFCLHKLHLQASSSFSVPCGSRSGWVSFSDLSFQADIFLSHYYTLVVFYSQ